MYSIAHNTPVKDLYAACEKCYFDPKEEPKIFTVILAELSHL